MSVSFYINGIDLDDDLNLSNTNAAAMMRLMGMPPSPEGQLLVNEMPAVQRRIEHLLDSDEYKKGIRPTVQDRNIIYCDIDAEYVVRRLAQFQHLLIKAQAANQFIYWG